MESKTIQIERAFFDALSTSKDEKQRRSFVDLVLKELPLLSSSRNNNINISKAKTAIRDVLLALDAFEEVNRGWAALPVLRQVQWHAESSTGHRLEDLRELLQEMQKFAKTVPKRGRAPRADVKVASNFAALIACQYWNHFQCVPITTKRAQDSKERTDFDKICDLVKKHFNISIGATARVHALEFFKQEFVLSVKGKNRRIKFGKVPLPKSFS